MPRRNESDSGRKNSGRSGGRSDSRRAAAPGRKTFKKDDRENPKKSSARRSSAGRPGSVSDSRPKRASGSADKPFKRSGSGYGRESAFKAPGKRGGRSDEETRTDRFSQKSRFAKTEPRTSDARNERRDTGRRRGAKSFEKRGDEQSDSKRPAARKPPAKGAFTRGEGRGESFGKPYKKIYKSRPDRTGAAPSRRRQEADVAAPKSDKTRLNKFIANSGISSRREADELITMGLISVNGQVVTELGYKVSPGDEVRYENKVLRAEKPVYILLNKPKGFITTTEDPQDRKTVMHIIGASVKERIYPVGRLDRNTTGLLLLTNDGDLADKLMHPSFNVKKVYKVELDRPLTKADLQSIAEGVRLEEGRATVDDVAIVSEDGRTVGIELHIGWNRVVRRIFEALGYEVQKLDRTVYAGLDKKELGRGQWRFLSKEEIIHLKHFK